MAWSNFTGDPTVRAALRDAVRHLASSASDPVTAVELLRAQLPALLRPGVPVDDEIGAALECAITEFHLGAEPRRG